MDNLLMIEYFLFIFCMFAMHFFVFTGFIYLVLDSQYHPLKLMEWCAHFYVSQGNVADELPERLIGVIRVSHIELSSAIVPKLDQDLSD